MTSKFVLDGVPEILSPPLEEVEKCVYLDIPEHLTTENGWRGGYIRIEIARGALLQGEEEEKEMFTMSKGDEQILYDMYLKKIPTQKMLL